MEAQKKGPTPGPWKVYRPQVRTAAWEIRSADGNHVAWTRARDSASEEEANAHLIAAAPDMREALEELLPLAHYRSSELDHEAAHAQDNESGLAADHKALQARRSIEKARAALEKAKGERR